MQIVDMTSLARLYVSTTEQLEVYIVAPQFLEQERDPKNGYSEG
jgi:adenylylsulfate kinase-like enzyme